MNISVRQWGVRSEAAEKFSIFGSFAGVILTGVEGSGQVLDWASLIPSPFGRGIR
jgi:hypothetical protein